MKFQYMLIISFVGISLIPGLLGLFELSIIEESTKEIPKNIEAISLSSELDSDGQLIRYYDEVPTQSARNYAFTQDSFWKERYFIFEPLLEEKINHAIENGDDKIVKIFQNVHSANEKLISYEYEAIRLVDAGNPEMAIGQLESNSYANNKEIYQNALEEYIELRGVNYFDTLSASTDDIGMAVLAVLENIEFSRTVGFVSATNCNFFNNYWLPVV